MTDLEMLIGVAQKAVTDIQQEFDHPNDDWISVVFLLKADNSCIVVAPVWEGHEGKQEWATQMLPALIAQHGVTAVAQVNSTWGLATDNPEAQADIDAGVTPTNSLHSYESLLITAHSADRDLGARARISRDGENPPTLGEWKKIDQPGGGMMVDDLKKALAAV